MEGKNISPVGTSWKEYRTSHYTSEEIAETDIKVALISEIITARHKQGLTQKQLEARCGVKQPIIARMERGTTDPQISTVIKVLSSLGKTLAVVDIENKDNTQ